MRSPSQRRLVAVAVALCFLTFGAAGTVAQTEESDDPDTQRPGHVILRNNMVLGEYVGFTYNGDDGVLNLFSVAGTVLFDTIEAPGPFNATADGGVVTLAGDGFNATVHDNPMVPIRFETDAGPFYLKTPFGGAQTAFHKGPDWNVGRVDVTVGVREGFVTQAQTPGFRGIPALDGSLFKLTASSVDDLSYPSPFQDQVDAAIQDRRVAAQYQVFAEGSDALVYEEVDVHFAQMENGSYRFLVDGHLEGGRAFVVNFAPGVFPAEELNILYYNETFEALMPADIQQASSLEDVLSADAGEAAEYWWVADPSGTHVIVSIPSFSVHAFDVLGIPPELVPLVVYGVIAGLVFAAVAGAGLFLRPRRT